MGETAQQGRVYLIGAGPGDPGLITVRGRELIGRADCLIYDALVPRMMLGWCREHCELVDAGKRGGNYTLTQEEINQLLIDKAKEHSCVVRLKGGDPYLFGRGGEEALALQKAGVPFEVVPGVSSALAGPAYAGIPVTHRDFCSQLTIFTGHGIDRPDPPDLARISAVPGTKVMLMGMGQLRSSLHAFIQAGMPADTPAAAIQWATTARQKTVRATLTTLADAAEQAKLSSPAVVVIGDVVSLSHHLDWRKELPLAGKRIIVTRTREQAGDLVHSLSELGAEVAQMPTLRIVPPQDHRAFAEAVVRSKHYDWLVFTSPNGVQKFFEAFFSVYDDLREIGGARIAALGPGTAAELKKRGVMVDVVPRKAIAEELIAEWDRRADEFGGLAHSTMLWVRAARARDYLYRELTKRKAIVDECVAYDVAPGDPEYAKLLLEEGADVITFTSSSSARHFVQMGLSLPEGCRIASMGPVTSATLRELHLTPDIEAELHTLPSLVDAICRLTTSS